MHPLFVQITTHSARDRREVRHEYVLQARHPRWELLKIFWHAFLHIRFR
jgi:hypothetical protein